MAKLIILGSSYAIPSEDHQNTHFVLSGESGDILVDCSGNTWIRYQQAGMDLDKLTDVILTHCHPDHISGIPSLLMNLWLTGRESLLRIHGLDHTLDCVEKMMALYNWQEWPDFFPVTFYSVTEQEFTPVLENKDFLIFSSPVQHIIPTIGLRMECKKNGGVIAYSCDTEPCDRVVSLARGASILLHETTGASFGHSSASQAGEIAQSAGVSSLYFIHYPPDLFGSQQMIEEASCYFEGEIQFARDLMRFRFPDTLPTE